MSIIWNIGAFLIAIAILVVFHEFGHFFVARRCGVKVHRFSVGFGPILWSHKDSSGTEYSLSAIPLGGYVKMLDGREDDLTQENRQFAFDQQSLLKRSAIVAAGPIANFIFAIIVYWLVGMMGNPVMRPIVGDIAPNSIAEQAGLKSDMEITQINGKKVSNWMDVMMYLSGTMGDQNASLMVATDWRYPKEEREIQFNLNQWQFDPDKEDLFERLGFEPYYLKASTRLAEVTANSPAEKAGLKVGDQILSIDGVPFAVNSGKELVDMIQKNPETSLQITIKRDSSQLELQLTPSSVQNPDGTKKGLVGIRLGSEDRSKDIFTKRRYDPISAISYSLARTKDVTLLTLSVIKKLFTGDIGLKNIGGPISIAQGAGMTAQSGFTNFLVFLALISINLGIMNLLPLPILDGGHLLFFAIEAITKRPISERIEAICYKIGGIILFTLMLVAITNDIMRI